MKLTIDTEACRLSIQDGSGSREIDLYTDEAFELISDQWVNIGWNQKYPYTFSWYGRPVIQLPEDMIRTQEVISRMQPDVIIETGVAHGGSLVFYSSLCKMLGRGRVIGIDITIRPHNRKAIEEHPLYSYITLVEGSSTDPEIVNRVRSLVKPGEKVMVLLDSCHSYQHVLDELEAYSSLVTPGSYIVSTDGVMAQVAGVPRGRKEWDRDNPIEAAREFLKRHPEFKLVEPEWPFNESTLKKRVTHWPQSWLQKEV